MASIINLFKGSKVVGVDKVHKYFPLTQNSFIFVSLNKYTKALQAKSCKAFYRLLIKY
jgi:hypothetical protein